jgi:hypothetical protein
MPNTNKTYGEIRADVDAARDNLLSAKADKSKAIASAKAALAAKEAEEGALERLLKEARRASRKNPSSASLADLAQAEAALAVTRGEVARLKAALVEAKIDGRAEVRASRTSVREAKRGQFWAWVDAVVNP